MSSGSNDCTWRCLLNIALVAVHGLIDWQYVLIIWSGVQWILIVIFVPETCESTKSLPRTRADGRAVLLIRELSDAPVLLRKKAVKLREETGNPKVRCRTALFDHPIPLLTTIVESSNRGHESFRPANSSLVLHSTIPVAILRTDVSKSVSVIGDSSRYGRTCIEPIRGDGRC